MSFYTYKIIRFFQFAEQQNETVKTGLTLEQAQAWCKSPETSSTTATNAKAQRRTAERGPWFDGYTKEDAAS